MIYNECNIRRHSKEHFHWSQDNSNNKLKDTNEVAINGILAQINGGTRNKFGNKGGRREAIKSNSIVYRCFICNSVEHKIYHHLHKDIIQVMFKEKAIMAPPKKKDFVVNMILAITTHNQIPENVVFKEKELPLKNKSLANL
jgi:hypothetical protein